MAMAEEGARFAGPPPRFLRRLRPAAAAALLAVTMGLLLGRFVLAGTDSTDTPAPAPVVTTESRIASLQQRLTATPDDPAALVQLGVAYLARARETADPTWYAKAAGAIDRSAHLAPDVATTLTASGVLDLTRHDFAGALAAGRRAAALDPASADALGVVTDALVELGRYDEAVTAAQQMVDLRPELASYARVSYVRELHGDVDGALAAMGQAVAAGGTPADVAYVRTLLGDIHLGQGQVAAAEREYRAVLHIVRGYGNAEVGLARVAMARRDWNGAIRILEPLAERLPFPATVALLGDAYTRAGRAGDAARQYDLVRAIEQLNRANGVAVDLELARFEADHATPAAVPLAEAALAARPTVFAEDTLAWALRQQGRPAEALDHARRAVRLGTADALLWNHLATIEADLGQTAAAAEHRRRALAINPYVDLR